MIIFTYIEGAFVIPRFLKLNLPLDKVCRRLNKCTIFKMNFKR